MNKAGKIYLGLAILIIALMVLAEYTKPERVNWFPSYAKQHKIPFGTYVFHDLLESHFGKEQLIDINQSPYQYLTYNDSISGTYVLLNNNIELGEDELESLLNWVEKGNTLLFASEEIPKTLQDTLQLKTSLLSNFDNMDNAFSLGLKNPQLSANLFPLDRMDYINYLKKVDSSDVMGVAVIGAINENTQQLKEEHITSVYQPFGKGHILLCTTPQVFTNYFILKDENKDFTAGLMSYFQAGSPILFDNHYKTGKTFYTSPMYVFLNNKELKWAYYIMLFGVLLYVIFEGKRKQRPIPVIPPLKNQTLDFTRTISNMYLEQGKHKEMAHHKIQYFLNFIRTHYYLDTQVIDTHFLSQLSSRSNNSLADTKALFEWIAALNEAPSVSVSELEELETKLDTFKSKNTWKATT